MKKIILTLVLAVSVAGALSAQVSGKAIGLRFGGVNNNGAEFSYQHPLGNANRLELDLGLNRSGFGLNGVYQWVWSLSELATGFNWYAGVGAGLGSYNYNNNGNEFAVGVVGQIGLEYNFKIPLQLSLDYRPAIYVVPSVYGIYDGICFSARFRF